MNTGTLAPPSGSSRRAESASKPSMPGISISRVIKSGIAREQVVRASRPSAASRTWNPALFRVSRSARRMVWLSSTTRTV